ncbi:MAG TPA: hypothetical protein VFK03_01475 [Candidatus Saccharimonadales bacterium]|nr:hypothetical protein [Candidatus Saccharimonadales bacterium]
MKIDIGQFIVAAIVAAIGFTMLASANRSAIKAFGGAFLGGAGAFAWLTSFYFVGWRWLNVVVAIVVVIAIAVGLLRSKGWLTSVAGVVLIALALVGLQRIDAFHGIHLHGALSDTFQAAGDMWRQVFGHQVP